MLHYRISYHSHLERTKTIINFRGQVWLTHPAMFWVKEFFLNDIKIFYKPETNCFSKFTKPLTTEWQQKAIHT